VATFAFPSVTLSIDDVTVGDSAGTATFTVTLSEALASPVTVEFDTADGTAAAPGDYTAARAARPSPTARAPARSRTTTTRRPSR
jgi:hypothetical protein